ncbi:hypothetical protein ZOSMA_283G00160 [Zostera marina]|uniref:Uncharacterized protein n=1 Tax=Zostera marina TaxID=29655 RepID=A0A0K9PCV8_ZOSMR|nr:hypothetical protein ZOSMA_283G00160 [Zostera marina]
MFYFIGSICISTAINTSIVELRF